MPGNFDLPTAGVTDQTVQMGASFRGRLRPVDTRSVRELTMTTRVGAKRFVTPLVNSAAIGSEVPD